MKNKFELEKYKRILRALCRKTKDKRFLEKVRKSKYKFSFWAKCIKRRSIYAYVSKNGEIKILNEKPKDGIEVKIYRNSRLKGKKWELYIINRIKQETKYKNIASSRMMSKYEDNRGNDIVGLPFPVQIKARDVINANKEIQKLEQEFDKWALVLIFTAYTRKLGVKNSILVILSNSINECKDNRENKFYFLSIKKGLDNNKQVCFNNYEIIKFDDFINRLNNDNIFSK